MKHLFAILLASAMVFAFAACSSSNDAPASQGTTEQEVATDEEKEEPAADATEEKPVEPEQPTDAEDAQQQTITGTIVESAEDTVTIQTEDGQELTFSLSDDTDRSQTDSLLAGNTLEVIYTVLSTALIPPTSPLSSWLRPVQRLNKSRFPLFSLYIHLNKTKQPRKNFRGCFVLSCFYV